jgi:hypothetical protein
MGMEEAHMLVVDASICQYKGCETGQKSIFYQVRFSGISRFAGRRPSFVFLT